MESEVKIFILGTALIIVYMLINIIEKKEKKKNGQTNIHTTRQDRSKD
jgi:hypothetical protein